jgi:hypothetical protein
MITPPNRGAVGSTIRNGLSSLLTKRPFDKYLARSSKSASDDCSREVSAVPRTQIFSEPISRNVGSCDSHPDHPERKTCGRGSVSGKRVYAPRFQGGSIS